MTPADLRARLKELPKDPEPMYRDTMHRIDTGDPGKKRLAHRTLAWIVLGREPLAIEELQHALAVNPGTIYFDPEKIFEAEQIRDACQGLVDIVNDVVSLVHYTAQSFFSSQKDSYFPGFHAEIAQACVAYLSLRILEQPDNFKAKLSFADDIYHEPDPRTVLEIQRDLRPRQQQQRMTYINKCDKYPFVRYSARHLGYHLRQVSSGSTTSMLLATSYTLVKERPKRNFLLRVMRDCKRSDRYQRYDRYRRSHETYSYYDSHRRRHDMYSDDDDESLDMYHDDDRESLDMYHDDDGESLYSDESESGEVRDSTPTHESALASPSETKKVDVNEDDNCLDRSEIQSQTSSDVDEGTCSKEDELERLNGTMQETHTTSMHLAVILGWGPLVQRLAEECFAEPVSQVNALDEKRRSPLEIAVNGGFFDVASILIAHGARVSFETLQGHTVLLHASQMDSTETVERLIMQSMDSLRGGEVLEGHLNANFAARKFRFTSLINIVWSIIASVVVFFASIRCASLGQDGMEATPAEATPAEATPAEATPARSNTSRSNTSRSNTSRSNTSRSNTSRSNTNRINASRNGEVEVIERLFEEGQLNPGNWDSLFYVTAFFLAVEYDQVAVVKDFLARGANVNVRNISGNSTALHRAITRNYADMVKVLLTRSPELELLDGNGHPPWDVALDHRNREIIAMLRGAGADINASGPSGVTRLYSSAAAGLVDEVRSLLESGVNPSQTTDYGWAPLHWAAHNGQIECVRLLLAAGAELSPVSDQTKTPLDMARKTKQLLIEKILLEAGALSAREVLRRISRGE
ncbi:hypothetical protein G7054_g4535 [Neopestalotiopsis clavispora]|nr:hypothetical protein G7054_g4535 [Neopestalotiopsis clavispora]